MGLLHQLGVLPPLDLAQVVAMAQVERAGALASGDHAQEAWHASSSAPHPFLGT